MPSMQVDERKKKTRLDKRGGSKKTPGCITVVMPFGGKFLEP